MPWGQTNQVHDHEPWNDKCKYEKLFHCLMWTQALSCRQHQHLLIVILQMFEHGSFQGHRWTRQENIFSQQHVLHQFLVLWTIQKPYSPLEHWTYYYRQHSVQDKIRRVSVTRCALQFATWNQKYSCIYTTGGEVSCLRLVL